jgi:hypothetical protein
MIQKRGGGGGRGPTKKKRRARGVSDRPGVAVGGGSSGYSPRAICYSSLARGEEGGSRWSNGRGVLACIARLGGGKMDALPQPCRHLFWVSGISPVDGETDERYTSPFFSRAKIDIIL